MPVYATTEQIRKIHAQLHKLGMMDEKRAIIMQWSTNNSPSSKDLTFNDARGLISWLNSRVSERSASSKKRPVVPRNKAENANAKRQPMRNKIIHYLCMLGYTDPGGRPDYERINNYIKNIGSRNPRKVILNYLWYEELIEVLNQVEERYKKEAAK